MSSFRHSYALVIGIDRYSNGIPCLRTAVSDAIEITRVLKTEHGYTVIQLLNEEATRERIQYVLEVDLLAQIQPDDRFLFYFAGHGIALNGDDGPEGYLIPQDASFGNVSTYLPMSQVHNALLQLSCRHLLGVLDCCFAGAFRWSSTRKLIPVELGTIHKERFDRFIQDPAWQVITSAAYDQTALDAFDLKQERGQVGKHSPFAAALIEALEGKADNYPPAQPGRPAGDGVITATELYLYLRDRVEPATEARAVRQTPGIHPLKKHDKGEYIFLAPGHPLNLPPAPPLDASKNPYRGLQSFEEEHKDLFFGRKALTQTLYEFFSQQALTVVLGASGSGKSSLVKAGLIPKLRQHPATKSWLILPPFRPGESPLKALNNVLTTANLSPNTQLGEGAGHSSTAIDGLATWFNNHPDAKVILIVDQLEELITLCQDQQERHQFLETLAHAISTYPKQFHLVVTLRSDFEPQFRNTPLETHWTGRRFVVPAMSREELREAIEEPASVRVIFFDPHNLVDQLIDEVANMPGALPLLSFALSELYLKYLHRQEKAKLQDETIERSITQADYDELGGVTRSLTQRADQEYEELVSKDSAYAQTIRNVMLRMVAVEGELSRRRVPLSELSYPEPENTRVQVVIRRLSDARLLIGGKDIDNRPYVEPAHDALVRGWQRLLAWQKADQEYLILQRRLTIAADEWSYEQKARFLWNANPRLDLLLSILTAKSYWFNQSEINFLKQSRNRRRKNRYARGLAIGTTMAVFAAIAFLANAQRVNAERQGTLTLIESSNAFLLAGQELESMIAAIKAAKQSKELNQTDLLDKSLSGLQNVLYRSYERNRLQATEGIFSAVAYSPDGKMIVTAELGGTIRLWALSWMELRQLKGHQGWVGEVVFSPDGTKIATAGEDGIARLWDSSSGKELTQLRGHQGSIRQVLFSQDGQVLVTRGDDGTVRVWNTDGVQLVKLQPPQGEISSVAISEDGKQIATGRDNGVVSRWDVSGKELAQFEAVQGYPISAIAFSSNNQFLAIGTGNGVIQLRDISDQLLDERQAHPNVVWKVAFSPDSRYLATGAENDNVLLWDVPDWRLDTSKKKFPIGSTGQIVGSTNDAVKFTFSRDSRQLAVGIHDGSIQVLGLIAGDSYLLRGHQTRVWSIAFSLDGKQIISSGEEGSLRRWHVAIKPEPIQFQGQQQRFQTQVVYSSNKALLASNGEKGAIQIWDITGRLVTQLPEHATTVLSFSSDGTLIATGKEDGTVKIWNTNGTFLAQLNGFQGVAHTVVFSPNNQMIAGITADGIPKVWDSSGRLITPLQGHQGKASSVSFSPDSKLLATTGEDNSVKLWEISGNLVSNLQETANGVGKVVFSPDGKFLATAGAPRSVNLWNLTNKKLTQLSIQRGTVMNMAFSPDSKLLAVGGGDMGVPFGPGFVKVWDLSGQELAAFKSQGTTYGVVYDIMFTPNAKQLATYGAKDGRWLLWDLTGRNITGNVGGILGFSPDGNNLVTGGIDDEFIRLWQLGGLDELLAKSCSSVRDYLSNPKTNLSDSDRRICDGIN